MNIIEIIVVDFFNAFGLYSLFFITIWFFCKNDKLLALDIEARSIISRLGYIYIFIWVFNTLVLYFQSTIEIKKDLWNMMFGKYAFEFWVQPFVWFFLSQIIKRNRIASNFFIRTVLSFLFIISLDKLKFFFYSFHRDYLPSSWTMYTDLGIYPSNFLLANIMKILLFLLVIVFVKRIRRLVNMLGT